MNRHCTPIFATRNDLQMNAQKMNEDDVKWMMRFYMEVSGGSNEGSHGLKRRFKFNGVCLFRLKSGYESDRNIIRMTLDAFECLR